MAIRDGRSTASWLLGLLLTFGVSAASGGESDPREDTPSVKTLMAIDGHQVTEQKPRSMDYEKTTLAALRDGGFVVGWTSETGQFVRVMDADGVAVSSEVRVSETTNTVPEMAGLPSGGFVIAWNDGDLDHRTLCTRPFNKDGTPSAKENCRSGYGFSVSIAPRPDGSVAVAAGRRDGIGILLLEPDGHRLRKQIVFKAGCFPSPSLATWPDGSFLVVWGRTTEHDMEQSIHAVLGQKFDSAGNQNGAEMELSDSSSYDETNGRADLFHASILSMPKGCFAVAWETPTAEWGSFMVQAFRFATRGTRTGTRFLPSDAGRTQGLRLLPLPNDQFLSASVVGEAIAVRRHQFSPPSVRETVWIRAGTQSTLSHPSLARLSTGQIAIAWQDIDSQPPRGGVFVHLIPGPKDLAESDSSAPDPAAVLFDHWCKGGVVAPNGRRCCTPDTRCFSILSTQTGSFTAADRRQTIIAFEDNMKGDWGYAIVDTTEKPIVLEVDRTGLGGTLCGGPEARFFGTLRRDDGRELLVVYEDQCGLEDGECTIVKLTGGPWPVRKISSTPDGLPIRWTAQKICSTSYSGPRYDEEADGGPYMSTRLQGIQIRDENGDGNPNLRVTLVHEKGHERRGKRTKTESRTEEVVYYFDGTRVGPAAAQ